MTKQHNSKIEDNFIAIPYYISRDKEWSMNEKSVYCFIAGFVRSTGSAFPGVETIADHTGLGISTVKEITRKLKEAGKITKRRRFGSSNVYTCDWTNSQNPAEREDNSQTTDDDQPESGSRSARTQTMNSQNSDTIRLDIKLPTISVNKNIPEKEQSSEDLIKEYYKRMGINR